MNYNGLIESIGSYDLQAAPAAVRLRFLRLLLRANVALPSPTISGKSALPSRGFAVPPSAGNFEAASPLEHH